MIRCFIALALSALLSLCSVAAAQTFPPQIAMIDPASKISIKDKASARALRAKLTGSIFGNGTVQTPSPAVYVAAFNPAGTVWATGANLQSIQEWRVTMSRGLTSRIFRFVPNSYRNPANGKAAVIVSAGHGQIGTYPPFQSSIQYFVASGYEVWTFDMPLSGLNAVPVTINDPVVGNVQIRNHDDLQALDTPSFNPLRIFLEPPAAIVDNLTSRGITNIAMFGLSGGGWTTTLYAALDQRIKAAYSFAGSMPTYARSWAPPHNAIGDWEQREITSLGIDYLDLYALAAEDRRFANIHNIGDDCCFGGTVASHYTAAVNAAVSALGGSYTAVFDATATSHTITAWGHQWMRNDLANRF